MQYLNLKKMQGAYNLRGRVNVIVAINNNIKNKYYVGFDFGYPFADKDKVKLIIDDNVSFEIDTFAQTAWINSSENPNLDIKIIQAMKKGSVLIAEGISKRGTETKDTYSLVGFTKAFNKVKMFVIKKNIYDLTKKDLEDFIISNKIKSFRTNQIWNWLYVKGSSKLF